MFPRSPEIGRLRSGLVLGVLLFVVCSLVAAPLSSAAAATAIADSGGSVDSLAAADTDGGTASSDGGSDITIDSALETDADGETVEVIVRLSEANVSPGEPPDQAATQLKHHAERTQGEVISYARSTDGVAIENRFWVTNAVLLEVDTSRVDLESFGRFEDVSTLHANFEVELDGAAAASASTSGATAGTDSTATTAGSDATYGLEQINATTVWDEYGVNGSGTKVAVLDTGVDANHPDIDLYTTNSSDPTYPGGWAEFDQDGNRVSGSTPQDFGDHGTHVSATVAGGNASGSHIGVAPGADLLHGAVLTDCENGCSGTYAQIIEGMQWAVDRDADVVSMSLGAQTYAEQFIDPVRNARSAGTIVVSSSGNDGDGTSGSPGNVYEVLWSIPPMSC
ncbi:S8 family serine peptidase [Natrinema sp. 1APR25-10V2]|uniref:S8 family serine peptidase n=1 Tax=Natrinema sp. 1APR25-10V2 TaxID=2951081 RepID=UPI002873FD62|nr:S8 family serine peptidase [Natrinema sp. 1APR25-10V2]MDS0477923.1 S8 family serine peptidase [Natrinema sp. 1APR25-10V2]